MNRSALQSKRAWKYTGLDSLELCLPDKRNGCNYHVCTLRTRRINQHLTSIFVRWGHSHTAFVLIYTSPSSYYCACVLTPYSNFVFIRRTYNTRSTCSRLGRRAGESRDCPGGVWRIPIAIILAQRSCAMRFPPFRLITVYVKKKQKQKQIWRATSATDCAE